MGTNRSKRFAPLHAWPLQAWILLVLLVVSGLAFTGYQSLYSSFATYDDEGYVMMSLQSYLDGHALYDVTYTQYGPAYYQISGLFHRLTQLPITHDLVRLKTLAVWLLTALLAGWITLRISRNKWLAATTVPLIFLQLDRFGLEPAHPQEFGVVLMMVCLVLATGLERAFNAGKSVLPAALLTAFLGCIVAIILLTKVNLGVFLILSFSLAILTVSPKTRIVRGLRWVCLILALAMPVTLMKNHLGSFAGSQLPLLVLGSTLITCMVCWRLPTLRYRNGVSLLFILATAISVSATVICLIALAQGTSVAGLWEGVILQHTDGSLFQYVPLFGFSLPLVVLSGWCANRILTYSDGTAQKWIDLGIFALIACLILRQFTDSFSPLRHGGDDRSLALLLTSVVTPFSWIVLIPLLQPLQKAGQGTIGFGRIALCMVAVLQPMQAYPIPGTQVALGAVCLVLILLIAASDAMERGLVFGMLDTRRSVHVMKCLATVVFLVLLVRGATGFQFRSNCWPLDLPGASRMRLPEERTKQIQWIVSELTKDKNATFLGAPNGYPSFYFWSQLDPPTHLNATYWPALLSADQQQYVSDVLDNQDNVLVLVHRESGNWQNLDTPLIRYLSREFEPAAQRGSHQIWQRKTEIDSAISAPQFGMR